MFTNALNRFRLISATEGLSFLLLIFIAMPIKYIGGNPYPVKVFGMIHGILFIIFMLSLFNTKIKRELEHRIYVPTFCIVFNTFWSFSYRKKSKSKS